jgi:hypothetical protein
MDIIAALKQEESKLRRQLNVVQGAIAALNSDGKTSSAPRTNTGSNPTSGRRTMSAAVRARISRTAKARWAKIRAEKIAGKKRK